MIPIRLDQKDKITVALDVAQQGAKQNTIDAKELRRLVMLHQDVLTELNLPMYAWDDAELLITRRVPDFNRDEPRQMQTAVWLKFHKQDYNWYVHGIYRTREYLPGKRIKIKDFSPETAYKAYKALIAFRGGVDINPEANVEVDGLSVFAIF